jgi:ribose 5-phosphate isomerase B
MGLIVAMGADHAGFHLKQQLVEWVKTLGHQPLDIGAHVIDPNDDFPDFALKVSTKVAKGEAAKGIIVCGSGVGASMVANKIPGIRAAMCHDTYSAHQGVEHDDMNVLCLGARIIGVELAKELVVSFLNSNFINEPKYKRRFNKVLAIESTFMKSPEGQSS